MLICDMFGSVPQMYSFLYVFDLTLCFIMPCFISPCYATLCHAVTPKSSAMQTQAMVQCADTETISHSSYQHLKAFATMFQSS